MRKAVSLIFLLLVIFGISFSETLKISVEFYGAKLGTAIDALSKISNKNVIWDETSLKKKDSLIYVLIRKPLSINKVFKEILKENGLTYVKQNGIYKISVAEENLYSIPREVIQHIGKDVYYSVLDIVKNNVSSTAEIREYVNSYSIYVRDTKENIDKISKLVDIYLSPLKKEAEKIAKAKEEEEKRLLKERELSKKMVKKELKVSPEEFEEIEDELIENLSDFGKYKYDKKTQMLVIWDIKSNFPKISKIVAKLRKIKVITKCFYISLKYLTNFFRPKY